MKQIKWILIILFITNADQIIAQQGVDTDKLLKFDYNFSGGTPVTIENIAADTYRVKPVTKISGSQFFYVCFKIDNFSKGELININVVWPSVLTANNFAAGTNPEVVQRQTQFGNFSSVVPEILFYSYDKKNWLRIPGKSILDSNTIKFTLKGRGKPLFFATQIPFTIEDYNHLLAYVAKKEPQAVKNIGNSQQGNSIHALAFEANNKSKETIFIQALQHGNEFTGSWVVNAMVHYLLDDKEGRKLRDKYAFHFIPAFHTDFIQYKLNPGLIPTATGLVKDAGKTENPNRDWIKKTWPEVNNVDRFISENMNTGSKYIMGFDLHNGWGNKEESGGCYLAFTKKEAPEDYITKQFAFNDFMIKNTDHINYRQPLTPGVEGLFYGYFYQKTGALSILIEFSRFEWWNRKMKRYTPYNQDSPGIYARQALQAMIKFKNECPIN